MWCSSDSYSILKTFIYFVVSWHCKYLILSHYFVSCPPVPSIYSSLHVEQMVTHEHLPISNLQICFEKKACLLRLYIYIYIYHTYIYYQKIQLWCLPKLRFESPKIWRKPKYNSKKYKCLVFDLYKRILQW